MPRKIVDSLLARLNLEFSELAPDTGYMQLVQKFYPKLLEHYETRLCSDTKFTRIVTRSKRSQEDLPDPCETATVSIYFSVDRFYYMHTYILLFQDFDEAEGNDDVAEVEAEVDGDSDDPDEDEEDGPEDGPEDGGDGGGELVIASEASSEEINLVLPEGSSTSEDENFNAGVMDRVSICKT